MMEVRAESCQKLYKPQKRVASHTLEEQKKIYTDWANHYLVKSGHKRLIKDLQQDITDGVLLAEIIQVVANEKIADINAYPESRTQMIENIDACLGFLAVKGVNIKGLCAEEILSGNLKAILGLFFSLSRYKQQQQQHAAVKETNSDTQATIASSVHSTHAPSCPLHRNGQLNSSASKAGEDMQSRLPGPSVQSRRSSSSSSSRRSQSFNHRDEAKPQMLACLEYTDKSSPSPIMVDQEPPSSPVPPLSSSTSTKGWRSKSLSAKHTATSSILSPKQSASASLETPPNVLAQKSMLDKLKLFNSRPCSQEPSITSMEDPEALKPELNQPDICLVHPEGSQQTVTQSSKLALKGMAQRTLGRTLVPKLKVCDKDKGKQRGKEKITRRSSGMDQDQTREERDDTRTETQADIRKTSLIPKGGKGSHNAKQEGSSQSGIPKPGQISKNLAMAKTLPSGKGEHSRGFKAGAAATMHRCPVESKTSSFASSLAPSGDQSQSGNTTSVQLPQTQHNHPNTATVAPFIYRSQTDMTTTGVIEGAERRKGREVLQPKSIHTSLESLTGEDPESRRLRTVKNIADLRQNLEETMSSLRHVSLSHSTLQTTFDTCITTEFSDRGSLGLSARPALTLPWRPGVSSPRLQAGDAPSLATGYGSSKVELMERTGPANAGYVSDGDILGKSARMKSATSGYLTDGGLSVYTRRLTRAQQSTDTHTPLQAKSHTDIDSWDDSSSVSSGISDALDTDELNTSSSLSSYVTTPSAPHRNIEEQLQTDAEKRCAFEHSWNSDDLRRPDGCSDPGIEMDASSKWCSSSDFSGESERSLTGRKTHTISQTGSWRRGMTAQLGVTCPRSKSQTPANCSSLKVHSNGKTDDAKVSEKSRFTLQSPSNEGKKLPTTSSTHIPTNTFGFKKTSSTATITASGAIITSGSATVGKIPKSAGFASTRLLSQQSSVDDGYLPPSARTTLQYRSLPRPSRSSSSMGTGRTTGRSIDASLMSKGTSTLPNPKSRSLVRCSANQTDREKGVLSDTDSLVMGSPHKASGGTQSQPGRHAGGRCSDLSSPTLNRMFGSKPATKPTPVTTSENLKNSTIISNSHTSSSLKGGALEAAVGSRTSNGLPYGENLAHLQSSTSSDSIKVSFGKEEVLSSGPDRMGTIRAGLSDRYAHLPQGRGSEDARDRLSSHPCAVSQDSPISSPYSPASTLSSPSSSVARFNFNSIGSPTAAAALRPSANSTGQDGPYEPHTDARLRNSSLCLVEKNRTMSGSGSFREALEEVHGSSLSLVSNTSSVYSTPEEKSQSEIRKLRRELEASQEKVSTLTTQLSANAHLVAAFEQSLGNMTIRLQSLTTTAEQKETELNELRKTIESLKKQNTAAQAAISGVLNTPETPRKDSLSATPPSAPDLQMQRQPSTDSVSSITSHSSLELDANSKKKRRNWLRSSFKQAFGKKKSPKTASSHSDVEEMDESSVPSSPRLPYGTSLLRHSHSNSLISECLDCETEMVMQLRSELRDKEMKLTDIRLEALSSAHQLDQLRESVNRMQTEMEKLKVDNERLRLTSRGSCSAATSQTSVCPTPIGLSSQTSLTESTSLDMLLEDSGDGGSRKEGHHVKVVVSLDSEPERKEDCRARDFLIGCIGVSGKTKWEVLDGVVRRLFKEYIIHVDPVNQLGLNTDSVLSYGIGDVQRSSEADTPELLPCGYLVGDSDTISVKLRGVNERSEDALVFETLIPKPILQRYVCQLQEHRRLVLSGPSGTGKSFLASRLAEHVLLLEGRRLEKGLITSFSVDNKSSKELKQYLSNLTELCSSTTRGVEAPRVVILENLHHVSSLSEIFNGLLSCKHHRSPYIIGTMSQSSSSSTQSLQLHHNFRWVLYANHTEPVKGFLGRFLRRKLLETEISSRVRSADLVKIIEWIPGLWQHLNRFLETHSSSDVTIGPRLFLSCPMDVEDSQVWFTDLWNYSIVPYMLEAVREGLQLYGRKAVWEDPSLWVMQSYPWTISLQKLQCPALLQLRREDVGFDGFPRETVTQGTEGTPDGVERDPLMNMLMRLKEAAHCTGPPSDEGESQQQQSP